MQTANLVAAVTRPAHQIHHITVQDMNGFTEFNKQNKNQNIFSLSVNKHRISLNIIQFVEVGTLI